MARIIDNETGEIIDLTVWEPDARALQNDADLIALSERILDLTIEQIDAYPTLDELQPLRGKINGLEQLLLSIAKSADTRKQVKINMAEAQLRCEWYGGNLIPQMQEDGILAPHGGDRKSNFPRESLILSDVQISHKQSHVWQKVGQQPRELLFDYFDDCRAKGIDISTAGFLRFCKLPSSLDSHQLINSSESNEWYTPEKYIEAARVLMGGIDLDPASCEYANQIVKAKTFYSIDDDGLAQDWKGRVWLNPPYGRDDDNTPNQQVWSHRLMDEYEAENVEQAVLLVNAVTDRHWFWPLWNYPICFVGPGRIRFYNQEIEASQPTHGTVLVYFGPHIEQFLQGFASLGRIVIPCESEGICQYSISASPEGKSARTT